MAAQMSSPLVQVGSSGVILVLSSRICRKVSVWRRQENLRMLRHRPFYGGWQTSATVCAKLVRARRLTAAFSFSVTPFCFSNS